MGKLQTLQRDQLLAAKVHRPPLSATHHSRPRLLQKLNRILEPQVKLILVPAPAGYGKTSLVCEWAQTHSNEVAWLSIDESDDQPSRFWQYFIDAIQVILPQFKNPFNFSFPNPSGVEIHNGLVRMINTLPLYKKNIVMVLEDIHFLTDSEIKSELFFLIDNLPKNLKLIITSRHGPDLAAHKNALQGMFSRNFPLTTSQW